MVDPSAAQKLYEQHRDDVWRWGGCRVPIWNDLTDEQKKVWEQNAYDYERKVSDGTDD